MQTYEVHGRLETSNDKTSNVLTKITTDGNLSLKYKLMLFSEVYCTFIEHFYFVCIEHNFLYVFSLL